MEAAPFTFAPGAAPPLDLSLDDIIKQRKKDDTHTKKQKPGAKATPGKKGKPTAAVRAAPRLAPLRACVRRVLPHCAPDCPSPRRAACTPRCAAARCADPPPRAA